MIADGVDPATLAPAELAALVKRSTAEDLLGLMRGERRRAVLDKIFLDMPAVFRPDRASREKEVVHWRISDRPDGGEDVYELVIADGACQVSASPRQAPRLALTIDAVDFLRVVTGNANPTTLFLRGRMRAKGDLGLAMRFPKMFEVPST
ncbi:SCP2 sterol-binding domain-containing protein [Rhizomonospora bruguierae]|uniref:SCP2 sterol-binding domain-containing protein n=1 Tax=Rhizomonospora bruguierae TaxID=1581705 RepID=UPI0020BF6169|nr:SCP2 sterol-binding domain-containing protein [Micromonospora sp. NBRC 107566]